MDHAEKIVTVAQRGTANTRWRDFADVWSLSRQHPVDGTTLRRASLEVAAYRKATLEPLAEVLDGYTDSSQDKWAAWRRGQCFDFLPENFSTVLAAVIAFADPVLTDSVANLIWNPTNQSWLPD
jgi:hypothetical protein